MEVLLLQDNKLNRDLDLHYLFRVKDPIDNLLDNMDNPIVNEQIRLWKEGMSRDSNSCHWIQFYDKNSRPHLQIECLGPLKPLTSCHTARERTLRRRKKGLLPYGIHYIGISWV